MQKTTNKEITAESKKVIDEILKRIADMSESEFKSIVKSMANFHNYSYCNQLILHSQGASQVAGFNQWKNEFNRTVKKGGRAIWILAPMVFTKKVTNKETNKEEEKQVITSFKSVPVFDISQTEGEEVKKNMTTKANIELETLLKTAQKLGYIVSKKALEVSCGGYISQKEIVLNSNLNETENIGTLIHELCHGELGHTDDKDQTSRSLAEQQAETTTAILCNIYGVERKSEFYLKSWKLDENIKESFSKMVKAVQIISKTIGEV
ncbi:MAG: ArdC-like ssDNA-binding domain-containing protein [bacterium]